MYIALLHPLCVLLGFLMGYVIKALGPDGAPPGSPLSPLSPVKWRAGAAGWSGKKAKAK